MSDTANIKPISEQSTAEEVRPAGKPERAPSIKLVPYPKIVFLYPTYVVSVFAAIVMLATKRYTVGPSDLVAVITTWMFLGVFAINLLVISFDFPRATSLTMLFFLSAIVLGGILLFTLQPQLLPPITGLILAIRPVANAAFFGVIATVLTAIYIAVLGVVRFDYWEVRPNELLHHHGILSDLKRYSSPNLRIDKEINDVFEYLLLGSGRLILQPSGERRAIILDNVLFISRKEKEITRMLSALQVEVRSEDAVRQ